MADVVAPSGSSARREPQQVKRRDDLFIALTALIAALCALPLAPSNWHSPEVSATLAVAAIAMLAGQRWAIAVVVIAELLLLPTVWPRALGDADQIVRMAALGSVVTVIPGVLAMRRGAAALVLLTGRQRTGRNYRRFQVAMFAFTVFAVLLPLL